METEKNMSMTDTYKRDALYFGIVFDICFKCFIIRYPVSVVKCVSDDNCSSCKLIIYQYWEKRRRKEKVCSNHPTYRAILLVKEGDKDHHIFLTVPDY